MGLEERNQIFLDGSSIRFEALKEYADSVLALKDIAPSWHTVLLEEKCRANRLKRYPWLVLMASQETCVVGEAYGFSSSYMEDCAECATFSQLFFNDFRSKSFSPHDNTVRHFVAHWNSNHRRVTCAIGDSGPRRRLRWYDAFLRFDDDNNNVALTYRNR